MPYEKRFFILLIINGVLYGTVNYFVGFEIAVLSLLIVTLSHIQSGDSKF